MTSIHSGSVRPAGHVLAPWEWPGYLRSGQRYAKNPNGSYVCDPNTILERAIAYRHHGRSHRLGPRQLHPGGGAGSFVAILLGEISPGGDGHAGHLRPTFAVFLLGVIVIVGGLIYFPMLILGPLGERLVG